MVQFNFAIIVTMENSNYNSVVVSAVCANTGKILIVQEMNAGNWTIPSLVITADQNTGEDFELVEKRLTELLRLAYGLNISRNMRLIASHSIKVGQDQNSLVLVFLMELQDFALIQSASPFKLAWIGSGEINKFEFAENVLTYLAKGFAMLPFMKKPKPVSGSSK